MNDPNEMYPHDQTGYGPTGAGNAPTALEMRKQRNNRFRTNRLSRAAQLMDPATISAVTMAQQAVHGGSQNPDEARRSVFSSSAGQMALDAAFMARRVGAVGYGDPVNFAANVGQGVASGGFNTQVSGINGDGAPVVGSPSETKGMGPIAERVSTSFMKSIIGDIYGGDTDPSNNYGYDMEETSQIFQTLASRGIIGDVVDVEKNATIAKRLEEGGKAATNPEVRAGVAKALQQVKGAGDTEEERNAELSEIIESAATDPRVKKELKAIQSNPNAISINDSEVKRVASINKEVVKGLASLSDLYSELSAPDALRKLEGISGTRITNRAQARQATQTVEELRQAAVAGGMDPAAYIKYSMDLQASRQGDVAKVLGTDERTSSITKGATAVLHNTTMNEAMYEAQVMQREVEDMRANGVDVADAPTANEIAADKWQGVKRVGEQYKGYMLALGGKDSLNEDLQVKAEKEMETIRNEKGDTTASRNRRQAASNNLVRIFQKQNTGEDGRAPSVAELFAQRDIKTMLGEGAKTGEFGEFTQKARNADLNWGNVTNKLKDNVGADAAKKVFAPIRDKLGAGGLNALLDISKDDKGNKLKRMKDTMSEVDMTDEEMDAITSTFFDESGATVEGSQKEKSIKELTTGLSNKRNGANSAWGRRKAAQLELEGGDKNGMREKIRDDKGKIGLAGIANAMLSQDSDFNSPESVALALEAFKNEEIAVEAIVDGEKVDLTDKFTSGIDFSQGLTEKGLESLDAANGKDMELFKKLKDPKTGKAFENREDMIEASKNNPELINEALRTIRTDEDYTGFTLTGGASNMTAMGDNVANAAKGAGMQKKIKAMAGARMLARQQGLNEDETNNLIKTAGDNEPGIDISQYEADTVPGGQSWNPWSSNGIQAGSGLKNQLDLADTIAASSEQDMDMLAATFEDSDILGQMEEQKKNLIARQKAGGGADIVKVGHGADAKETTVDAAIAKLDKNMEKLSNAMEKQSGAEIVKKMYVTDIEVTGRFNPDAGE